MKKKSNRGDLNARTVRQTEVCKYWDYDENDDIMEYKSPAVRWSLGSLIVLLRYQIIEARFSWI